jgi:TRAP-type C4-dicarboxylate transport system substrate-binding protein
VSRILGLVLLIVSACWSLTAQAEPTVLKLSYFGPSTDVNYDKLIKHWVEAVNSDPSGAVKIEAYPNGALGKSLPAQPQMVLDGVVDIAFINPSLVPGRFPDDQVLELPGLFRSLEEATRAYQALLTQNALRGYSDYVIIGSMMNPNYNLTGRRPMRSLRDLKGMKVRIVGPIIGQTVKELGLVPVMLPPPEIVEAMGRGTIDAATVVPSGVVDFGLEQVTNHDYLVPLGHGPLAIVMNKKKYQELPAAAKEVLSKYGLDWTNNLYLKNKGAYEAELIAKFKADPKRTVTEPSATDMVALSKAYERVTSNWVAKSEQNKEVLAKVQHVLQQIRKK